jgi:hypothetical protein
MSCSSIFYFYATARSLKKKLRSCYAMAPMTSSSLLSSSVCRLNGFRALAQVVFNESFWILTTMNFVGIDLGYCNPTRFQTRGPKVQKWMFLLFVHEVFFFNWFWWGFFYKLLRKITFRTCIVLLCNYYRFLT